MRLFKKIYKQEKESHAIFTVICIAMLIGLVELLLTNLIASGFSPDIANNFILVINRILKFIYDLMFSVLAGIIASWLFSLSSEDNRK